MHSSRMRTMCCLSQLGRECLSGGVCLLGGCLPGGVCPGGCLPGGCLPARGRGVCLGAFCPGGVYISPLWTEFLTHACENIAFLQLRLQTVNMNSESFFVSFGLDNDTAVCNFRNGLQKQFSQFPHSRLKLCQSKLWNASAIGFVNSAFTTCKE